MACVSFMKAAKPHYLGALLVILAPNQGSIILQERRGVGGGQISHCAALGHFLEIHMQFSLHHMLQL